MRLLFDQNISFRITKRLYSYFSGCKHVSDFGLHNCEDHVVWQYARKNNLVIVTFDSDFYDISLINGHPPKIIWIRKLIVHFLTLFKIYKFYAPVGVITNW